MKALFSKQMRLVAHPMTYVFLLCGVMFFIPNYPYSVAFFYVTLGIFFMFMNGRDQRDAAYSALLPIRKQDTVTASILFCGLLQLVTLILCIPFAFLARLIKGGWDNLAGVDANLAVFGIGCLVFAVFNLIFFPAFYRSGYRVGTAFLKASIGMSFTVFLDVILPHLPGLAPLDGWHPFEQGLFTAGCFVFFFLASYIALLVSIKRYEKVDL